NAVFTSSGLRYFPVENQSISADSMLFNTEGSLFYFDIVVRAEAQGRDYNIDRNNLVGIEGFPAVVKVANPSRFEEGDERETTEEYLGRVETSLTEKSFVVSRGIRARLLDLFDNVKQISAVGMGDPEMNRDIITGSPLAVYAVGLLTARSDTNSIYIAGAGSAFSDGKGGTSFTDIVEPGDIVSYHDMTTGAAREFTVINVVSPVQVRVSPVPPDV